MRVLFVIALLVGTSAINGVCEEPTKPVGVDVTVITSDDTTLVSAADAAKRFGWTAKEITRDVLLVLCRETDESICVPVRLKAIKTKRIEGKLYVEAAALGKVLGFNVVNGKLDFTTETGQPSPHVAYNAEWPRGRGFNVGQTLPDIPLTDMQGHEVRFDSFLGKRYIIYCWASW